MNQFETNSKTDCSSTFNTKHSLQFNVLFYKIKIVVPDISMKLLLNQISFWNLPYKFLSSNHDILISRTQQLINAYGYT